LDREQIVGRRKKRLLHLSGVKRPADEYLLAFEINAHKRLRVRSVSLRLSLEERGRQDREIGFEILEFRWVGTAEQLPCEQRMPGEFAHDAQPDPVFRIGSHEPVNDKKLASLEVSPHPVLQRVEHTRFDRPIGFAPIDKRFRLSVFDEEAILRRAAGTNSGQGDECPGRRQCTLVACKSKLDQTRRAEIPVHISRVFDSRYVVGGHCDSLCICKALTTACL
jgi:hypothetical protein